jgi:hypothetical protein
MSSAWSRRQESDLRLFFTKELFYHYTTSTQKIGAKCGKSNPRLDVGNVSCYHYTNLALKLERRHGLEPRRRVWKTPMLPLHQHRSKLGCAEGIRTLGVLSDSSL